MRKLMLINALVLLSFSVSAADYIWTGATPTVTTLPTIGSTTYYYWDTTTNWSPNGIPGVGDTVTINNDPTPTITNRTISTFTINGGTVVLTSSNLTTNMIVNGGSLRGAGTITGNLTQNGGTISPISTIAGITQNGTLKVTGDYTQTAGTLAIAIAYSDSPDMTSIGIFDRLQVTGAAAINGTLVVSRCGPNTNYASRIEESYAGIITCNNLTGQFTKVTVPDPYLATTTYPSATSPYFDKLQPLKRYSDILVPSYSPNNISLQLRGIEYMLTTPLYLEENVDSFSDSTVVVSGFKFSPACVILLNGVARPTTFVPPNQLKTTFKPGELIVGTAVLTTQLPPYPPSPEVIIPIIGSVPHFVPGVLYGIAGAFGTVGIVYNSEIACSGSRIKMIYTATNLPPGLELGNTYVSTNIFPMRANITGIPTTAGTFETTFTATNIVGTSEGKVTFIISVPQDHGPFTSPPTITPNPGTVGDIITFSTVNINGVIYNWNFGDGSYGSGASTTHTYMASGLYDVTVTASGNSQKTHVVITTNKQDNSTTQFSVTKGLIKFNFSKQNNDLMIISGTVPLEDNFSPNNQTAIITIGDMQYTFTLDDKGSGNDTNSSFKLIGPIKNGIFSTTSARFLFFVKKQSLFTNLENLGFTNQTTDKDGDTVDVPIILMLGNNGFIDQATFIEDAKAGKGAIAKLQPQTKVTTQ